MSATSKVYYKGRYVDEITKEILETLATLLDYGDDLTLVQGGFNRGGVSASAGTHDGGGAFDLTYNQSIEKVKWLRLLGTASWRRFRSQGFSGDHVHGIVCYDDAASSGAKYQVHEYLNQRGDGLVGSRADYDKRPTVLPIRFVYNAPKGTYYVKTNTYGRSQPTTRVKASTAKRKPGFKVVSIATVRVGTTEWALTKNGTFYMKKRLTRTAPKPPGKPVPSKPPVSKAKTTIRVLTYNLPDEGTPRDPKLPNAKGRIPAAAALIKSGKPDVFGINELVGSGKEGFKQAPSAHAKAVSKALGSTYTMLTPTTAWNENYQFFNKNTYELVQQHEDVKLYAPSGGGGRHLSICVLRNKKTGFEFVYGLTHLVSNINLTDAQGDKIRQEQGALVDAALNKVSKEHGGIPIVVTGDMNTHDDIKAFTDTLENTRKTADEKTNETYSTYANIKDDTPNKTPEWIIDHIWVSKAFHVNGYTVLLGLDSNKTFPKVRPSDHVPVVVSITR